FNCGVDRGWLNEGFVSLDVDYDPGVKLGSYFRDSISSRLVLSRGHLRFAAVFADRVKSPLVVGCYNHAGNQLCAGRLLEDAYDHRYFRKGEERLTRQSSRGIPRR